MTPELLVVVGLVGVSVVVRIALRRWVVRRWEQGRLTGRPGRLAIALISFAPLLLLTAWLLVIQFWVGLLLALVMLPMIGLFLAMLPYVQRHGGREGIESKAHRHPEDT